MTTSANVTAGTAVSVQPYIFFYGRCEEALEFYKSAIGGTYEVMRISETPMADQWAADFRNKIMHATFNGPGFTFMAADGREGKTIDPEAGNISVAIGATDSVQGERIFAALSEGGRIDMPLGDAFWGGRFGMITDRFGIEWLMTLP